MSVTIHSKITDIDSLIPRVVDCETEDCRFKSFFYELYNFHVELEVCGPVKNNTSSDTLISNILTASETITIPKKSWEIATREYSRPLIRAQCSMTRVLMENIYFNLEGIKEQGPRVQFMSSPRGLKYTIGGNRYRTRVEGAAIVGPRTQYLPIISFTGGLENQTWDEFLIETYSAMLGQLTRNLSILQTGFEDQEVFIIGFHGPYLHIARGYFPKGLITRVHAEGYSENETKSLNFTRGYNLCFKEDWLEAIRALSRLLRYIISGKAKVGAVQVNM
ncbi:hypothetical protein BDV27DRAFT_170446 [Aspergillus caelatus]|uniref:Uncharacterized protein n=1 Tax=Aspergillus caelatus TaxID=61420 RepID=A0A5N6ZJ77_9EURO|nr:uncharacterized protein BDV27DRAFT_170446 [Aspergillus caelatus]KAE8357535.1 hypothetical protein BDV27DRAFT_170446 [Aspergillus caelatus]